MKLIAVFTLAIASVEAVRRGDTRIASLKKQIVSKDEEDHGAETGCMGAFNVKSFDKGLGEISLKMSAKGVSTPLPTFLQAQEWIELKDTNSPLKEAGYDYWMADKEGLVFKSQDGSKKSTCSLTNLTPDKDDVQANYKCKTATEGDEARFKAKAYPYMPLATMPYANSFTTAWLPVSGSMYGNYFNSWDAWNYDYYSFNNMGLWGCSSLNAFGACAVNPYYYPFSP